MIEPIDLDADLRAPLPAPATKPTDERYTPAWLIELIVRALGPITYDPCAAPHNPTGALTFTALPDNGLARDWLATTNAGPGYVVPGYAYVNSPFSLGNLLRWAKKARDEAARGCEVVMLTPIDSTTEWYEVLTVAAAIAAPLKRRPTFDVPADRAAFDQTAKQPAMLWYLGTRTKDFLRVFTSEHARCFVPGVL